MKRWPYFITIIAVVLFFTLLFFSKYKNATTQSQTSLNNTNQPTSTNSQEESFDINSLDLSNWDQNNETLSFWFPKNDITVVKNIENSYSTKYTTGIEASPIKQQDVDTILSTQPISKISQELEKQNFTKLTESTGFFANDKDSGAPYYLITYKKGGTICQLNFIFECLTEECVLSQPSFGCANFDLEKDYQNQKQYYQLLSNNNTKELYLKHQIAITSVSKNSTNHLLINSGSWSDGGAAYFDGQNNKICEGKPCCDQSSKDNPNLYGDWCKNQEDYQLLETYKPVGL